MLSRVGRFVTHVGTYVGDPGDESSWLTDDGRRPESFLRTRLGGMLGLALVCAFLRPLGPNRVLVAAVIAGVVIPLVVLSERMLPPGWVEASHPFIDVIGIITLIHLVPSAWFAALLVGTCSVTAGAMVMTRLERAASAGLLVGGMALAAYVHHVHGWVVPILALPTVLMPVGPYADWYQGLQYRAARRIGLLVDSADALLWEVEIHPLRLIDVRGQCERVTGHRTGVLVERLVQLIHPDDLAAIAAVDGAEPTFDVTFRLRGPDDTWRFVRNIGRLGTTDGTRRRAQGISFDVTELEESRRALRVHSETDDLTGLPNRRGLASFLDDRLSDETTGVAFALIDIDGFKDINDTLGHPVGDLLIGTLGQRLKSLTSQSIGVVRLGGDEFGIVMIDDGRGEVPFEQRVLQVATLARETIGRTAVVEEVALNVSASVGVALGAGRASASELLRDADIAMYEAKRARSGVRMFAGTPVGLTPERLELQADLARRLEDEMELWFQPIIDTASSSVVAVEGLARWVHPGRGVVMPGEFLELVDALRLNDRFDRHVLGLATQAAARLGRLQRPVSVAVNLSVRGLRSRPLMEHLTALLTDHPGAAGNLTVEVSERDLLDDASRILPVLSELRNLGVGLSLDDYGTGFSSLIRLRELPFTELKIDRSFVGGIATEPMDQAIVRSTVDLARSLGMVTVAEGVETAEVLDRLVRWECERAQGFLFGRAVPLDDLINDGAVILPGSVRSAAASG